MLDCKIGSMIGTPLASNSLTRTREHLAYARILVKNDISKDLKSLPEFLPLVTTDGRDFDQKVCYELIPYFCDHCKIVGHDIKHYSLISVKNKAETAPEDKLEVENGGKNLPEVVGSTGMVIGGVEKVIGDDLAVARAGERLREDLEKVIGTMETVRRKRSSAVVVAGAGERLIGGDGSPSQL